MHQWKVSDLVAFSLRPRSSAVFQSCLCHKSGVQGPVTEFSIFSWKTFKSVAKFREDDIPKSDDEIYHLASGLKASEKIEKDLLTAHEQGKQAMLTFFQKIFTKYTTRERKLYENEML